MTRSCDPARSKMPKSLLTIIIIITIITVAITTHWYHHTRTCSMIPRHLLSCYSWCCPSRVAANNQRWCLRFHHIERCPAKSVHFRRLIAYCRPLRFCNITTSELIRLFALHCDIVFLQQLVPHKDVHTLPLQSWKKTALLTLNIHSIKTVLSIVYIVVYLTFDDYNMPVMMNAHVTMILLRLRIIMTI